MSYLESFILTYHKQNQLKMVMNLAMNNLRETDGIFKRSISKLNPKRKLEQKRMKCDVTEVAELVPGICSQCQLLKDRRVMSQR